MLKVLIADDEAQIRNGIVSFIDWAGMGCQIVKIVANGLEAWEYIQQQEVDMAVCDIKMPGLTGLEIAQKIQQWGIRTKIIILTAYPDFDFAKIAIKYGVIDYVVKTAFIEELPAAVRKAAAIIIEEKAKTDSLNHLSQKLIENRKLSRWKIALGILQGNGGESEQVVGSAELFERPFLLFSIEITDLCEPMAKADNQKGLDMVADRVFAGYDIDFFTLSGNFVILIVYLSESSLLPEKTEKCAEIIASAAKELSKSVRIGISTIHSKVGQVGLAYHESLIALSEIGIDAMDICVFSPEMDRETNENRPLDIREMVAEIENNIEAADDKGVGQAYDAFMEFLEARHVGIENLIIYNVVLLNYFFKGVDHVELKKLILYEDIDVVIQQLYKMKTVKSVYLTTLSLLKKLCEHYRLNRVNGKIIVREIAGLIRSSYDTDISLEKIAQKLHLNSNYLSRLYKKETGEGIIESLNKYRIDLAKKMLLETDLTITQICERVGIPDPAYFTHVFKKHETLSPKEYRKKCEHRGA